MKKNHERAVLNCGTLLLAIILLFSSHTFQVPIAAATKSTWKSAYQKILNNWKTVEKYETADTDYLKSYFGTDYKFNRYFLCDVDKNGTPEFFLYSTTMGLTVVFTYKNSKLVCLGCDDYYKINTSYHELLVKGHWHGAGGSGDKEYSIYKIKGTSYQMLYYIDNLSGNYSIYDDNWNSLGTTKTTYNKIYNKYCKTGTKFTQYKKYKLTDTKGLTAF